MIKNRIFLTVILFCFIAAGVNAQMTFSGVLESSGGLFMDEWTEFQNPLIRFRLTPEFIGDRFKAFVELEAERNFSAGTVSFGLGEAYAVVDPVEGLSIWAGQRIISWGTAIASNPVGFVNPVSFENQLTSDKRADWLIPIPLVSARYIRGPVSIEAVYMPFFYPNEIPGAGSRWYPEQLAALVSLHETTTPFSPPATPSVHYTVNLTPVNPELEMTSSQGAGRIGLSLGFMDLGVSGMYGFTKNPVVSAAVDPSGLSGGLPVEVTYSADYRRQGAVGLDASATVLDTSVVWLESSLTFPDYYSAIGSDNTPLIVKKNTLESVIGMDRTFSLGSFGDLYFALEGSWTRIFDFEDTMVDNENVLGASAVGEVRSANQDFTFRLVVMEPDFLTLDATSQFLVRSSIAVKVVDSITVTLGAVLFNGTGGYIGQFDKNDFAYVSIRAAF